VIARAILLAGLLLGLLALHGVLERQRADERSAATRVRRLIVPGSLGDRPIALVRIGTGDGRHFVYQRDRGLWRCTNWRGALARGADLESMIAELFEAQGVVLTGNPARPSDFGLDVESMRTLRVSGPGGDVGEPDADLLFGLDVGAAVDGRSGAWVRPLASTEVWSLDVDIGAQLGREDRGPRPPLLDEQLISAQWPSGGSPRFKTISVSRPGAAAFELELTQREVSQEEMLAGVPPFEWLLRRQDTSVQQPAAQIVAVAYTAFLTSVAWNDIVDPALAGGLGLDSPVASLTLQPGSSGDPLLLLLLPGASPAGNPVVFNSHARLLYEIRSEQVAQIFPLADDFAPEVLVNPWQDLIGSGR